MKELTRPISILAETSTVWLMIVSSGYPLCTLVACITWGNTDLVRVARGMPSRPPRPAGTVKERSRQVATMHTEHG
jgi:hypothetical protein